MRLLTISTPVPAKARRAPRRCGTPGAGPGRRLVEEALGLRARLAGIGGRPRPEHGESGTPPSSSISFGRCGSVCTFAPAALAPAVRLFVRPISSISRARSARPALGPCVRVHLPQIGFEAKPPVLRQQADRFVVPAPSAASSRNHETSVQRLKAFSSSMLVGARRPEQHEQLARGRLLPDRLRVQEHGDNRLLDLAMLERRELGLDVLRLFSSSSRMPPQS